MPKGTIIETKSGLQGIVLHGDFLINGKVKVYLIDENQNKTGKNMLCSPENIKPIGFVD